MERRIIHLDMDAFYASVEAERRDMEGEPLVVCVYSGRSESSGAVSTCSYEARELGISAGMPISRAEKIAEDSQEEVNFVPMDRDFYRHISDKIKEEILEERFERIEQASIDEFYIDASDETQGFEEARDIAERLKGDIEEEFNYTCSVGIGPNKLVAKIASGREKPDGMTVVEPEEVDKFMESLELEEIHGIGPKTVQKLESLGIDSVKDLRAADRRLLVEEFGEKQGAKLIEKAKGKDDSPVEESRQKQISRLTTLKKNSDSPEYIQPYLEELTNQLFDKVKEEDVYFSSVALLVIDTDLKMHTRSKSIGAAVRDKEVILDEVQKLLKEFLLDFNREIRRIGVRVKDLEYEKGQKRLKEF